MKRRKYLLKLTTLFIACILTITSVPMPIISLESEAELSEDISNSADIDIDNLDMGNEYNSTEVFIVEEDVSKRGEFEKHYLCSDGTYVSVSYAEAVHYLDSDNTWKDVDQSLVLDTKTGVYKNKESDFTVAFSQKASANDMVSISKGEHTMSWGIEAVKDKSLSPQTMTAELTASANAERISDKVIVSDSIAKVKSKPTLSYSKASERLISAEDSFVLPNASSQITYDDVFSGEQNVSIQYTVFQNKIEEDIIIYNRSDIDSVSMNVDVGTLIPIVNDDKSVDFVDDENIMQFHIDIPYMIDADMNVCNDIEVVASKEGTNCTITYIPNKEWFNSEERVFPIVLDPAVTTNDYASSIEDTYVEENSTAIHTSEQYLQLADNGDNRRKVFIRIKQLPMVDESMPIISGKLELTSIYGPLVDVYLNASYHNWGCELTDIEFALLDSTEYVYTCTSCQLAGNDRVVFDISNYIYQIYSDEKILKECNVWCGADFTIEYASELTSSVYPFYSSEYTDKSCRPTLTVRYGYSLPAGMHDGEIYSFQNVASGAFMSVVSENPSISTNVFQKYIETDESTSQYNISTIQQFKLEYVPSTGGYLLRPVASSNGNGLVVEVYNAANNFAAGGNVQLYGRDPTRMQEWLIVPYDNEYFRIIPRTQMSLTLMSKGYVDGNNSNKGVVDGNIFVKELEDDNYSQIWLIYDENGDEVITTEYRSDIESGNYYITNFYSGRYLHSTGGTANCISGKISALGDSTVKWKIVNLGDGYCTIQHATIPGRYLAPASNSSGSTVRLMSSSSDTIPDMYKWMLVISQGDIMIRHKITGYYLYGATQDSNPSNVSMRPKYTNGSPDYNRQKWRFVDEDNYVELYDISFYDQVLDKTESILPRMVKAPRSSTWSYAKDFEYTITSGSQYVSFNATNYRFTGVAPGTAQVKAVHKTTGITKSFEIKVNKNAIIIIPGIMGTELVASDNNSQYPENTKLWSYDLFDGFENLDIVDAAVEVQNIAYKIQSLECNNNGASINGIKPYNGDNSYGTGDSYKELYEKLSLEYSDQYSIDFFAYDWRKSNDFSAQLLNIYIESKDYDKVFLVAHSMGGLVASGYLALGESRRNKVEGLVMLGAPLLGTPSAPYIFGSEDVFTLMGYSDIPTEIINMINVGTYIWDPLGAIVGNFTSIYELFPSEKYFDNLYGGKTYLRTKLTSQTVEHLTYSESLQYYDILSNSYNASLMVKAGEFHNSLYVDGVHVTELVNTYYIAGYGIDTTEVVSYESGEWISNSCQEGDSLVPVWSATLGDRQPSRTIYAANVNHMELIGNANEDSNGGYQECLDYIVQLISGDSSLSGYQYLSQEMPVSE